MAIRKHEFYEGAALHQLIREGVIVDIKHDPPFFLVNQDSLIYLKYNTRGRSPWGFTFTLKERSLLEDRSGLFTIIIGLVCGADGIAALKYHEFSTIVNIRKTPIRIACQRKHGHHYLISGPDGTLQKRIPPSLWRRLFRK